VADEGFGGVGDQPRLVQFPQSALVLRVGTSVAHDLVAAFADAIHDLRTVLVEEAVGVVRERQTQFGGEVEQAPDPHAIAVVAPRVVALGLRLAGLGEVVAQSGPEREHLDVRRDAEGQPASLRP
jgi:hypothetical protein